MGRKKRKKNLPDVDKSPMALGTLKKNIEKQNGLFFDDFGSRSPVIQKTIFRRKMRPLSHAAVGFLT